MINKLKSILKRKYPRLFKRLKKIYRTFVKLPEENAQRCNIQSHSPEVAHVRKTNDIVENLITWSDRVNKILIVGRIREGDSIASHTNSFLNSIDYSAYDVFLYDEYSHNLYLCKSRTSFEFVKTCFATELDPAFFDIMFYVNVLDNCEENFPFEDRVPPNSPYLSFSYPVFDGTVPPEKWVNTLNMYFDGVIVPCNNLKNIFENAGVVKPVFELPIALDLGPYLERTIILRKRDEYIFGWIGTFEDRKNPFKIIEAFTEAFGNNEKVKLVMHTRFVDRKTQSGERFDKYTQSLPSNIVISEGVLPDEEIINLMSSFDTYIYVSQGEGYSITPRQAMACGLSVVLSAIPTHLDITDLDEQTGVFWVPATKEIDAVQPSLNNCICGKMFDIETEQLVQILKHVYANRESINKKENIVARQKAVKKYDISNQKFNYCQMVLPNAIRYAEYNRVCDDGIETNDMDLLLKYEQLIKHEKRNIVVCPAHDGGFCSVFNKWLSHLVYMSENTILIPDWRIKTLKAYVLNTFGKRKFTSFCYGTEEDGNIFFKCFCNPYKGLVSEEFLN